MTDRILCDSNQKDRIKQIREKRINQQEFLTWDEVDTLFDEIDRLRHQVANLEIDVDHDLAVALDQAKALAERYEAAIKMAIEACEAEINSTQYVYLHAMQAHKILVEALHPPQEQPSDEAATDKRR